jgi:hypothetical protein
MAFEDFWMSEQAAPTGESLRFSAASSTRLSRTPAVSGNRRTWTWSCWLKRGGLGTSLFQPVYLSADINGASSELIGFRGSNAGAGAADSAEGNWNNSSFYATNALYRDPGAWYHHVMQLDTTQALNANRLKLFVNGVQVSLVSIPALGLNQQYAINDNRLQTLGNSATSASYPFDGYMSDIFMADGLIAPPTTFGYFDANGVWVPKSFSAAKAAVISAGGFGTNGYALRFESQYFNSGTLAWSDQSGNGNDFTANWNCATGAGGGTTGADIVTDGPVANYATINPLYPGSSTSRANLTTANATGKPSILPAFGNSGTVPQVVGVNGAGVSWNGTEAGWTSTGNISFGQQSTFTTATGLSAVKLNAKTVPDGSAGFQAVLAPGANILTTAQAAFPNGLWWVKDRVNANNHQLVDSVRGGSLTLQSNTNAVEGAYVTPAGNSVAWCWNLVPGCSNGFDIVTYTNTATSASFNHNLGVTPQFIILKGLGPTASVWSVFHTSLPNMTSAFLNLNNANAVMTLLSPVPAPTSTTFGSSLSAVPSSENSIAYLWASVPGFSAFGSYTGNGSADGPFVYCSFLPAFVLVKCSSTTGNWEIYDNARNTYNPETLALQPNLTNAESTITGIDFLSNGFKIRTTDANLNGSGQTYIYAAFAENPFGGSNVAPVTAR